MFIQKAVLAERSKNAELLLKKGANINLKNNESKTAVDLGIIKKIISIENRI